MTPAENMLLAILLFVLIMFVGVCVLIYWAHKRDRTLKIFKEQIEQLKKEEQNEGDNNITSGRETDQVRDKAGEKEST